MVVCCSSGSKQDRECHVLASCSAPATAALREAWLPALQSSRLYFSTRKRTLRVGSAPT